MVQPEWSDHHFGSAWRLYPRRQESSQVKVLKVHLQTTAQRKQLFRWADGIDALVKKEQSDGHLC